MDKTCSKPPTRIYTHIERACVCKNVGSDWMLQSAKKDAPAIVDHLSMAPEVQHIILKKMVPVANIPEIPKQSNTIPHKGVWWCSFLALASCGFFHDFILWRAHQEILNDEIRRALPMPCHLRQKRDHVASCSLEFLKSASKSILVVTSMSQMA